MAHRGIDFKLQWDELDELMDNCSTEYKAIGGDEDRYTWNQ